MRTIRSIIPAALLAFTLLASSSVTAGERPNSVMIFLEQNNVIEKHPETAERLRKAADSHLEKFPPTKGTALLVN
ncbi:MAG: hypothetical protein MUF86_14120 [Akkermansiaceae bacterium]|nr:hypothetical protein [Akkermansiaceae bacterium]